MKIAIISDIHSNISALRATYDYFAAQDVDHFICLGDIIGIGAHPEECVQFLREHEAQSLINLRGNHEDYMLNQLPIYNHNDPANGKLPQAILDLFIWNHMQLSESSMHWLRKLPHEAHIKIEGVEIYASHYPSAANGAYAEFIMTPDLKQCAKIFRGKNARVNLFGHTHVQCLQKSRRGKYYINPGSIGCPVGTDCAFAGLLEVKNRHVNYQQLQIPYDVRPAIAEISAHNQDLPALDYTIDRFYRGNPLLDD